MTSSETNENISIYWRQIEKIKELCELVMVKFSQSYI